MLGQEDYRNTASLDAKRLAEQPSGSPFRTGHQEPAGRSHQAFGEMWGPLCRMG